MATSLVILNIKRQSSLPLKLSLKAFHSVLEASGQMILVKVASSCKNPRLSKWFSCIERLQGLSDHRRKTNLSKVTCFCLKCKRSACLRQQKNNAIGEKELFATLALLANISLISIWSNKNIELRVAKQTLLVILIKHSNWYFCGLDFGKQSSHWLLFCVLIVLVRAFTLIPAFLLVRKLSADKFFFLFLPL